MMTREPPWEQNGVPSMISIMRVALAKSWSARGSSHQPACLSSSLNISHTCLPCLPSGKTLVFLSDLFVVGRLESQKK